MFDAAHYGPWALIAGGSEGLAASFAGKLGDAGMNLILVARRPEPLEELAQKVRETSGVEVRTLSLDLKQPDMLTRIRDVTKDVEVGLLIFNAGELTSMIGPFVDRPLQEVLSAVQVTAIGQTTLAHEFGRDMTARGRGGIILVGSMSGAAGLPYQATYSAAKAFSQTLAEALWCELKPRGVDILSLVMGVTDTPARRRAGIPDAPGLPVHAPDEVAQEALDNLADGGPVYVSPRDAKIFEYLCSADRRQIATQMSGMTG